MEHLKINIGKIDALYIHVEWLDGYGTKGPVGLTWGNLQLWVGGTLVWGSLNESGNPIGITWSWIDLVEFLGNAFPYLMEEEQYPVEFNRDHKPTHLGKIRQAVKFRRHWISSEQALTEDNQLQDFLTVHDFSHALQGAYPPNLLFLRRGKQMLVATNKQEFILSYSETIEALGDLGNAIVARISHLKDPRSFSAVALWESRSNMSNIERLKIATKRSEEELRQIWPIDLNSSAGNDDVYELKAAARMIGRRVNNEQLKNILSEINSINSGNLFDFGEIRTKAKEVIEENFDDLPAIQGYLLAIMLRQHLKENKGKVDPGKLLKSWKVSIRKIEIKDCLLDAIAVWGKNHNPTIFLNTFGPRALHPTGERVTLAHEICHILVDTEGALPVVEVLGGDIPRNIEARANAFAAEFLLPRSEVAVNISKALEFVKQQSERDLAIDNEINRLVAIYGVSHETVTWQIINSDAVHGKDLIPLQKNLKSVSDPF